MLIISVVTFYFRRYVKDADKHITANIKAAGRLVDHASLNHSCATLFS
jgi:isoleucyl-tRNA synthetase